MKNITTTFLGFFFYLHCHAQEPKLILPIGHTMKVTSAQFSPDGKKIITAFLDRSAKIWDAVNGTLLVDFVSIPKNC